MSAVSEVLGDRADLLAFGLSKKESPEKERRGGAARRSRAKSRPVFYWPGVQGDEANAGVFERKSPRRSGRG